MVSKNQHAESLRRIAILIDGLDRSAADQLLEQFSEDHQRQFRDAVVGLEDVSELEQQLVSREFYDQLQTGIGEHPSDTGSALLDRGETRTDKGQADPEPPALARPLRTVLETASLESLARLLQDEQPQTISLVVAALSPGRAAEFLTHWSPARQAELLRRVAELSDVDESFVVDMQDELATQLSLDVEVGRDRTGWQCVRSILSAAPRLERDRLLNRLAEGDGELARELASESARDAEATARPIDPNEIAVAFDRFVDLDRRTLIEVFSQLPVDVSALALAGASQLCLADILGRLPGEMSRQLEQRLDRLGPLRLSDIRYAQQAAVNLGRRAGAASTAAGSRPRLKLTA